MSKSMELLNKAVENVSREIEASRKKIRCNNTNCGCYDYGNCSSDSLVIMWNDKRNSFEFKCDFNRRG